jgi:hypothetical protein
MQLCKKKGDQMIFEQMLERVREAKANGFDEAVFVGRLQMTTIIKWGYLNERIGYIPEPADDYLEHAGRPEVEGLPVYLVNAHDFFKVA